MTTIASVDIITGPTTAHATIEFSGPIHISDTAYIVFDDKSTILGSDIRKAIALLRRVSADMYPEDCI